MIRILASADSLDAAGKPVYYGGGRLAADLTLPKLRARWEVAPAGEPADTSAESPAADAATGQPRVRSAATAEDRSALTPAERVRIWEQATAAAARATAAIQAGAEVDPRTAGDAAWAASDFLAAAGRVVEGRRGGPLTTAAVDYDRAARELWGRVPPPSQAGQGLRAAAVAMTAARFVGRGEHQQLFALLAQLGALADAVTRLRENQHRAAQAAAARSVPPSSCTDSPQCSAPPQTAAERISWGMLRYQFGSDRADDPQGRWRFGTTLRAT